MTLEVAMARVEYDLNADCLDGSGDGYSYKYSLYPPYGVGSGSGDVAEVLFGISGYGSGMSIGFCGLHLQGKRHPLSQLMVFVTPTE